MQPSTSRGVCFNQRRLTQNSNPRPGPVRAPTDRQTSISLNDREKNVDPVPTADSTLIVPPVLHQSSYRPQDPDRSRGAPSISTDAPMSCEPVVLQASRSSINVDLCTARSGIRASASYRQAPVMDIARRGPRKSYVTVSVNSSGRRLQNDVPGRSQWHDSC